MYFRQNLSFIMIEIKNIDHYTVSFPEGKEEQARYFYKEVLQLVEIPNLVSKAIWFKIGDIELHVSKEDVEQPISSRHAAFVVENLEEIKGFLKQNHVDIQYSSVIEGRDRCFFRDPFGNRFELIEYDK